MKLKRRVFARGFVAWIALNLVTVAEAALPDGLNEAWIQILRGRHEEAVALARADLVAEADSPRAAVCLVEALHRLGREDEFASGSLDTEDTQEEVILWLMNGKRAALHRRVEEAEANFRRALATASVQNDSSSTLVAVEQLANLYQNVGRFPEAIDLHQRALRLAKSNEDPLVQISSTYGLAYCLISRGEHAESKTLADQALQNAHKHGLDLWIGNIEGLRATLAWFRLDLAATLTHLESAESAYRGAGDGPRQASALRRIAATHISTGAYPLAIENLQTARTIALAAGDTAQASFCLEHLGSVHADLGDLDGAETLWQEALREGNNKWPPEWANATLSNLGSLLATRGRYEEALAVFREALDTLKGTSSELNLAGTLTRIAICLRESGRTTEALEQLREAVSSARKFDLILSEAQALKETALCHLARNDLDEAEQSLLQASQLAHGSNFPNLEQQILVGLAEVARERGQLEVSLRYLEEGMSLGEEVRNLTRDVPSVQEAVFGRSRQLYDDAVDLLQEMHRSEPLAGHDRAAFRVAQRAKARSLLDLLTESKVDLRARADTSYHNKETEILQRLMELTRKDTHRPQSDQTRRKVALLENELTILERNLRSSDPEYAELKFPEPVGARKIQQSLRAGELLVEFLLGDERSYVWAATVDTILFEPLPPRNEIETEVRDLLALLRDYNFLGSDPTYLLPHLRRASSMLLDPLAPALGRSRSLTICPDGILHFLPFEVLLAEGPGSAKFSRFSDLPYLVKTLDVSYAHSGTAHRRLRTRSEADDSRSTRDLLLVGDPIIEAGVAAETFFRAATGTVPPPLPYVGREIAQLANLVAEDKRVVLTGVNATLPSLRAAAKAEKFRLVHFATHGVFNESRPRFSGILLTATDDRGDDGFLTMNEVFALELACDQVVLSTCSSALGETVTGEGLVGLTRGLLYAGAQSVVAALWSVSGEATSQFMGVLYEPQLSDGPEADSEGTAGTGYRADGTEPVDARTNRVHALAEAKRRFIREGSSNLKNGRSVDFAHPYFWAPFVFTGADR